MPSPIYFKVLSVSNQLTFFALQLAQLSLVVSAFADIVATLLQVALHEGCWTAAQLLNCS